MTEKCNFLFPLEQTRNISVDYDEEADVLYISYVKKRTEATDATQIGDYIIRFVNQKVIGITIINALEHINESFKDMPNILQEKSLIYA